MKIIDFKLGRITANLKKPFITNIRKVEKIEDVFLTLITDDGIFGFGEAPPTVAITNEDIQTIETTIKEHIFPAIKGVKLNSNDIFEALHTSVKKNSSAKACVDMAIYDILAKSEKKPLYKYLNGEKKPINTNLTISLNDIDTMINDSLQAYQEGFSILKIKLGKDETHAVKCIQSIRKALPNATLRLDANQAWDIKTTLKIIDSSLDLNIELIEQPVMANDLEGMRLIVASSPIPILADESVFSYEDAVKILNEKMAHYINIKLMKTGGIYEAIKIANLAKQNNAKVMIGSMLESVVSISAAVHFAMSDDNICFYDLDGPLLAKDHSIKSSLAFNKDEITVQECIGLGVR